VKGKWGRTKDLLGKGGFWGGLANEGGFKIGGQDKNKENQTDKSSVVSSFVIPMEGKEEKKEGKKGKKPSAPQEQ